MKKWLAAFFAILAPVAAFAVVQNPLPGYIWTYLGPTLGADWQPPSSNFSIIAPFSTQGSTPLAFGNINIGNYPVNGMIPAGVAEGLRSAMVIPNTYTQAPLPNTNFSAYCDNQNGNNSGASCVNYFSLAVSNSASTNTAVFGSNSVLANTDPAHAFDGRGLGVGQNFGSLTGVETDINVWALPGGVQPLGQARGFTAIGGGDSSPTGAGIPNGPLGSIAFETRALGVFSTPIIPWDEAFHTDHGAATVGMHLGALTAGTAASASQPIFLDGRTTVNTGVQSFVQTIPFQFSTPSGALALGFPANGALEVVAVGGGGVPLYTVSGVGMYGTDSQLATNAAGPFFYVNAMNGPPTGAPALASTGRVGLVVDLVNHKLCWYETGVGWKCVTGS